MLTVYVDDFKLAGPHRRKRRRWKETAGDPDHHERGGACAGGPEPQVRVLGCNHIESEVAVAHGGRRRSGHKCAAPAARA